MNADEHVRLFGLSSQLVERELDAVEKNLALSLDRYSPHERDKEEDYYPQFKEHFRREAAAMADHYEIFYCLERSIRDLVREKFTSEKGAGWWDTAVPEPVRQNVEKNIERERHSGVTLRSADKLDYTTFGELGDIVRANWPVFVDIFNSDKAFTKVMNSLNMLRAPIAHCCPLAEDEVIRLRLTIRDWFRLME